MKSRGWVKWWPIPTYLVFLHLIFTLVYLENVPKTKVKSFFFFFGNLLLILIQKIREFIVHV